MATRSISRLIRDHLYRKTVSHWSSFYNAQHPDAVMVWWGVSCKAVTPFDLCANGLKSVESWCFKRHGWAVKQYFFRWRVLELPTLKAKATQQWLKSKQKQPVFKAPADLPSGSPGLNPLNFSLWAELGNYLIPHRNLESLKKSMVRAASKVTTETVRVTTD